MPAPTNEDGLTLKQERFVAAYVETNGNAVRSAEKAGYNGNYKTIAAMGVENLEKPRIQQAITKRLKSVMDGQEVLEEFTTVARHKPDRKDIKTSDKLKALELLAKYHNLINDAPTINVSLNHWNDTIIANAMKKGIPEQEETAIVLSLPQGIVPEDVRAELAKRIADTEND